ncbi:MAG: PqiA/YebS family transporter subunit [Pseudomonadales bacterium]|jgi:paraquat-inducible protein A|nr:PqiA/YebS family transporter subunit [Pseudomonadales bacterium]
MSDQAVGALVACHECDRLHRREPIPPRARADCRRCGAELYRHVPDSLDRTLACHLSALLLLLIAVSHPFLGMKIGGLVQENHVYTGALTLWRLGMGELGLVVAATSIVFPALTVLGMIYVLLPVRFGFVPTGIGPAYRVVRELEPWSMVGVFLIGTLISVVKLKSMAAVLPGIGLYAFAGALVMLSAARANFEPSALWARVPPHSLREQDLRPGVRVLACHTCSFLAHDDGRDDACPRCGTPLHHRRGNSITRTWALVLSATMLMIPAQLYPVMTVSQLGRGSPDTILSGVVKLLSNGYLGLAAIVFVASVVVPVAKLAALVFLLRSVEKRSAWRPRDRTFLYRVTEVVGAWSMVDVFLVGLLSGLVSLDLLASVEPGIGATFFGGVVVLTMLAARSFDPRLIWDEAGHNPAPSAPSVARDDPDERPEAAHP